jgi:hypothetical protein
MMLMSQSAQDTQDDVCHKVECIALLLFAAE